MVVVHEGGTTTPASTAGSGVGDVGGEDGVVAPPPPVVLDPETLATPATPLPLHAVTVSGTHVKPSPQSLSIVHGRSYRGTHDFTVVVVQAPASMATGTAQAALGGQLGSGAGAGAGQLWYESA